MRQLTWRTSLEERPAEQGRLGCDGGKVTLLAGRNVSPYKNFGPPSRVNSGLTRQSEHVGALLVWKKLDQLPIQFSYKCSLKLTQLEESHPRLPGKWGSLEINRTAFFRALKTLQQAIHRINLVKRSLAVPDNLRFPFSIISKKCPLGLLFRYSQTPLYDTRSIRTSHYYEQFSLSLRKESPYIFPK